MLKFLKKALQTGVVTGTDPLTPPEVDKNFRGKPEQDPSQCIACAACMNACPANALTVQTNLVSGMQEWSLFLGRCIFCGRCEEVCPTHAIVLTQEVQMAVWRKEDLYQKSAFPLATCAECGKPFAVAKELQYAEDLLMATGQFEDREALHQQLHTCPHCKRAHNITQSQRINLSRLLREPVL
ncbi:MULTISPECIES: formate hydrogenlyase complex iron-sulfur subunit [Shewanella]|uniref:formate hydrogenlyase complex iron-sulfur subunit n=1 Tax=Shewanella TaxID=22 RepID=UPI00167A3A77|nr:MULTISPECIES: formate hydrogenlyase complex iron-sulfur subunit [Shewanella]MBO1271893.1 4Fe-4S dicluster domain-containing protein [Shewanella sp. 4t3-1-2LB]MCL2905831.1 4Fe-4S dicluster domain-containing protein [Shewanella fodinae]GGY96692.1 formate hydrogenlyase complex iron-sulfur subunit [Shewanella fodinae]